jgi:hypothetical protein
VIHIARGAFRGEQRADFFKPVSQLGEFVDDRGLHA